MHRFSISPHYVQRASIDPSYIASLNFWLKADTGVTGSNPVTAWADQSGGAHDLSKSAGNPQLVQNVWKSGTKPSFRPDSSTIMISSNVSQSLIAMWCVLKTTSTGAGQIIVSSNDANEWMGLNNGALHYSTFSGTTQTYDTGSGLNDGNLHTIAATHSGTAIQLFIDGALSVTQTRAINTANGLRLGGTAGATVDIAEVAMWNIVPSALQFSRLHNYALARWG